MRHHEPKKYEMTHRMVKNSWENISQMEPLKDQGEPWWKRKKITHEIKGYVSEKILMLWKHWKGEERMLITHEIESFVSEETPMLWRQWKEKERK